MQITSIDSAVYNVPLSVPVSDSTHNEINKKGRATMTLPFDLLETLVY